MRAQESRRTRTWSRFGQNQGSVILANGGVLIERFCKPEQYGSVEGLRYRIDLR